jgi:trafficking protein particle complex subunit 10
MGKKHTNDCHATVECVDPSNLFATFKPLLLAHLPLRNLHWKSSKRPLRSIDTLHVDLIKDGHDITSGSERRHQIPGLRQTPYLKVYLLRCDDNETYKATCRKQVRDWIKSSALPGESKKGSTTSENHDAYEWLIVHVIVPETPTAVQSRAAKDAQMGTTDSSDSIPNKSKWTGKSSATVLEKLRADFNGSSKSNIDRVAEVRIFNAEEQPSAASEEQIDDFVEKLKLAILTSFDLRVRQYEDDIREKDSQRNLPGWNFNTFFILKEGLARGFENVGLLDDALVGYDELALGLEVVVHEQLEGGVTDHGGKFIPFSDELKGKIQACLKDADEDPRASSRRVLDATSDPAERLQRRDYPLDASKSPFRDYILANDISIFDFRLYIFSRQLELLLRRANALSLAEKSPRSQSRSSEHEEYFLPLAEACQRAVDFITNGARTLRHDLELALDMEEPMSAAERKFRSFVATNFVLSWVYVSSMQVLVQTRSPNLMLPEPPPDEIPSRMRTYSPSRSQSPVKSDASERPPWSETTFERPSSQDILSPNLYAFKKPQSSTRPSLQHRKSGRSNNTKTGGEELAGARAELYLLARAAVEQIGTQHDWSLRWGSISSTHVVSMSQPTDIQDVPLKSDHQQNGIAEQEPAQPVINGLQYRDLRHVFHSLDSIKTLYGCLTTHIYRHFLAANRLKSAEKAIADIALLRYEAGDFEAATSYLSRIASFYGDGEWTSLEGTSLELYANCQKQLGRHGEYVSNLLRLLGQLSGRQQTCQSSHTASLAIDGYLADLWSLSTKLTTSVHARLSDFFTIKRLAPNIHHYPDKDGFFIPLEIKLRLGSSVELAQGLEMILSSISDSSIPMITMVARQPVKVGRLPNRILLDSNLCISGWYAIDRLQITVGNITFLEDYKTLRLSTALDEQARIDPHASLRLFIYPSQHSLKATASPAPYLHLAQTRSILIEMETGWNETQRCSLSMKSGTPGLRLRLNEAKIDSSGGSETSLLVGTRDATQALHLTECRADSNYKFLIPYNIENADIPVIHAKLDVEYSTARGNFIYSSSISVNTILPVSVNVQDFFRENALLSRFTISPATLVPLRLWKCDLHGSKDNYTIESHVGVQDAMDVFPKQPASFIYRFQRQQPASSLEDQASPLAVSVKFSCLDEVVLKAVENRFNTFITMSPVAGLIQPLCAHLLSTFRSQWSAQDLEVIGLCHEIEIWPFEDIGWDAVLAGFTADTRSLARTWLKKWHRENNIITVYSDLKDSKNVPARLITIPVDIPKPPIVATASLEIDPRLTKAAIMSEAFLADLEITYTRTWATASPGEPDGQLQISFEVVAPPENWIIGGSRKGSFLATATSNLTAGTRSKEEFHSVPIILIPQRTGHLLLPSVEVRCFQVARVLEDEGVPTLGTRVPCEVDIKSASRSVHVVSGLRETVVEIVVDEAQGLASERRTWLVGSKGREGSLTT